ncbi:MAG: beta-ketoacyl-[acyl-carrier-protein] synthase family protein [Planctomycetota bacterium]
MAKRRQKQRKKSKLARPELAPVGEASAPPRRDQSGGVAITGLGLICGLGVGVEACWEALRAGRSGLRPISRFPVEGHLAGRGGEAPALPGAPEDPRDRAHHALTEACREALAASGRETFDYAQRAGLVLGSSLAAQASAPRFWASLLEAGPDAAAMDDLRCYDVENRLSDLAWRFHCLGESLLVSNACAAGASALGVAADLIRLGRADAALVAGYDALDLHTHAGFGAIKALDPAGPRPLAPDRAGMLLGDGYAAFVLEPYHRVRSAGRPVLARLLGYGESADAHHLTQPDPQGAGAALAMERALTDAGLTPERIDAVNLHCTATPTNDAAEVAAMRAVFGARLETLPLFATKPAVGHTLGGAGALEAAVALLALRAQTLPATLGAEGGLDPALGLLDLVGEARPGPLRVVMSNSFGFGGCNASLIFELGPPPRPGKKGGRAAR